MKLHLRLARLLPGLHSSSATSWAFASEFTPLPELWINSAVVEGYELYLDSLGRARSNVARTYTGEYFSPVSFECATAFSAALCR